ncbi:hypothetical protein BJV78DRAFT_1151299 [Lactifluus subvellereus]|nr:hypothetical protein BJV78DRAFT_1151299 [Lactifluus subvellereus]
MHQHHALHKMRRSVLHDNEGLGKGGFGVTRSGIGFMNGIARISVWSGVEPIPQSFGAWSVNGVTYYSRTTLDAKGNTESSTTLPASQTRCSREIPLLGRVVELSPLKDSDSNHYGTSEWAVPPGCETPCLEELHVWRLFQSRRLPTAHEFECHNFDAYAPNKHVCNPSESLSIHILSNGTLLGEVSLDSVPFASPCIVHSPHVAGTLEELLEAPYVALRLFRALLSWQTGSHEKERLMLQFFSDRGSFPFCEHAKSVPPPRDVAQHIPRANSSREVTVVIYKLSQEKHTRASPDSEGSGNALLSRTNRADEKNMVEPCRESSDGDASMLPKDLE